jgi:hypothetical protein
MRINRGISNYSKKNQANVFLARQFLAKYHKRKPVHSRRIAKECPVQPVPNIPPYMQEESLPDMLSSVNVIAMCIPWCMSPRMLSQYKI